MMMNITVEKIQFTFGPDRAISGDTCVQNLNKMIVLQESER